MINVTKSQPGPGCLKKEIQKANGDYKCGDVVERLKEDFKNKCYLCEIKEPTSINVDHFLPHKGDKKLKFDWNNLFYACPHCNNTKRDKYTNILNCTNPEHDVENWIKYEMRPFPKERAIISAQKDDDIVNNTVKLLSEIYNGTTRLKNLESSNIRQALLKKILDFQQHLLGYYNEDSEHDRRNFHLKKIKKHLAKASAFTTFKRWIIKDNSSYRKDFNQFFD